MYVVQRGVGRYRWGQGVRTVRGRQSMKDVIEAPDRIAECLRPRPEPNTCRSRREKSFLYRLGGLVRNLCPSSFTSANGHDLRAVCLCHCDDPPGVRNRWGGGTSTRSIVGVPGEVGWTGAAGGDELAGCGAGCGAGYSGAFGPGVGGHAAVV